MAFTIGLLWHGLVYSEASQKTMHVVFFALVLICSVLVDLSKQGLIPIGLGLIQKALYGVSLIWLLWRYRYG